MSNCASGKSRTLSNIYMPKNLKKGSFLQNTIFLLVSWWLPCIVPEKRFRLEKIKGTRLNQCLTVTERENNRIFGKSCTSSLSMRWISTKNKNDIFQLMNVMTLQCLKFVEQQSLCNSTENHPIGQVAMKQCGKRNGQYIVRNEYRLYTKLCDHRRKNFFLRLAQRQKGEGYRAYSQRNKLDSWFNEDKNQRLRWQHIPYRG